MEVILDMYMVNVNLTRLESPGRWPVGMLVGDYHLMLERFIVGGTIPWESCS